jgi:hypothetical protein
VAAALSTVVASAVALSACTSPSSGATVAVFTAVHRAGVGALAGDAAVITKRLGVLGERTDSASVRGTEVIVSGPRLKVPAADLARTGRFSIRQVLCGAPAYSPLPGGRRPLGTLPPCGARYATTAANLGIDPSVSAANGYTASEVPPDPAFAPYPSTSIDDPNRTELLSGDPVAGAQQYPRFVVGPAAPDALSVASASAVFDTSIDAWAVMYTLTPTGARAWDGAAAAGFHRYVAIDLDGLVESAPIIQPVSSTFSSFGGRGEISGNFTATSAKVEASLLDSGPLDAPLRLRTG